MSDFDKIERPSPKRRAEIVQELALRMAEYEFLYGKIEEESFDEVGLRMLKEIMGIE